MLNRMDYHNHSQTGTPDLFQIHAENIKPADERLAVDADSASLLALITTLAPEATTSKR